MMFLFLYADDTVILAESENGLQRALDSMYDYCVLNKLKVNTSKTKVVVFSRGKIRKVPNFIYNGDILEVTFSFQYLGIKLNYNNKFKVAQKELFDRASKAMYSLLRKSKKLMLPIDVQIELFDKMIVPILLYGSEIWCPDMSDLATRLQLKFYKMVLGLSKATPSMMVLGELGKYPLEINAKSRMLLFWYKLVDLKNQDKLSSNIYTFLLSLYNADVYKSPFLLFVHNTLNELGYSNIWLGQLNNNTMSASCFKKMISNRLKDQYVQKWFAEINQNELFYNYRLYKEIFIFEEYIRILPENLAKTVIKFRTLNHRLPIQRGRILGIERNDRKCEKCPMDDLGDEFHYLLQCSFFNDDRNKFLKKYFFRYANTIKFRDLLTSTNKRVLIKLAKFIRIILDNM